MKYHQQKDGEWVTPRRRGYMMACCDCGLTHRVDFRVVRGVLQFRATRAARATSARRRKTHTLTVTQLPITMASGMMTNPEMVAAALEHYHSTSKG